jgi:hypothetical protein
MVGGGGCENSDLEMKGSLRPKNLTFVTLLLSCRVNFLLLSVVLFCCCCWCGGGRRGNGEAVQVHGADKAFFCWSVKRNLWEKVVADGREMEW